MSGEPMAVKTPAERADHAVYQFAFLIRVSLAIREGLIPAAFYAAPHAIETPEGRILLPTFRVDPEDLGPSGQNLLMNAAMWSAVSMANAWNSAVEEGLDDRLNDEGAVAIMRLMRNAFSHQPFDPVWRTEGYSGTHRYLSLSGRTRELDARALEGERISFEHLGGLAGFLELLLYLQARITGSYPNVRESGASESESI